MSYENFISAADLSIASYIESSQGATKNAPDKITPA